MVVRLESANNFNKQASAVVKFGTQGQQIPAINKAASDTVSFSGKKKEPYSVECLCGPTTLIIPKGYKDSQPIKTTKTIEVGKDAELGEVQCRNDATIKGKLDKLILTFETLDTCMIRTGKDAKIRELVIGNNSRPTKATVYFNISSKALKDPENFQKITINGRAIGREDFIKFAKKSENELHFNNITLKTTESAWDALLNVLGVKSGSKDSI